MHRNERIFPSICCCFASLNVKTLCVPIYSYLPSCPILHLITSFFCLLWQTLCANSIKYLEAIMSTSIFHLLSFSRILATLLVNNLLCVCIGFTHSPLKPFCIHLYFHLISQVLLFHSWMSDGNENRRAWLINNVITLYFMLNGI